MADQHGSAAAAPVRSAVAAVSTEGVLGTGGRLNGLASMPNAGLPSAISLQADGEADATMQAFSQWLSEMKARSNSSLAQMTAEMSIIRDGITSNSTDLTEYKRHSISIQQQMQSQLADLREKLTSAFGEISALSRQKQSTDKELNGEVHSLQQQLELRATELDNLKKSYSNSHQVLQSSLIQIQGQLQSTGSELAAAKRQAQSVLEGTNQKMGELEGSVHRLRNTLETTGREGQNHSMVIQEDIAKLHEALTSLSADFFDHKRVTLQVQNKLTSQVSLLEDDRRKATADTNGAMRPQSCGSP